MDTAVTDGYFVTLPPQVEVPLRININGNPAFARDVLYEFVMNGPGSNDPRIGWSWEDQGTDPTDTVRTIRLSQPAVAIRALVRLKTTQITSMDDFIPLHSKWAVLLMMKAIQCYIRGSNDEMQLGANYEKQALAFITEEQKSRDIFKEIAQNIDKAPIQNFSYHTANTVVVSDIYDEVSDILGGVGRETVFDNISEAIKVLSNKGSWDSQIAYLDAVVPESGILTLPREVETPLRINIDNHPAFSRSKLFEFSINGPGSDMDQVTEFTWMEKGYSPVISQPAELTKVKAVGSASDNGKSITLYGLDSEGREAQETILINTAPSPSNTFFQSLTRVSKEETLAPVQLMDTSSNLLSTYYPDELEPIYRQIQLSNRASAVKVLFKRSNVLIKSLYDFIPLRSKTAIITMIRSLNAYRAQNLTPDIIKLGQALEEQALKLLKDEQDSRNSFSELASKEQHPALGVNYHNRDSIVVADIYDDAADIFGPIGQQRLFDKITESVEMMNNKSSAWDGLMGFVDIVPSGQRYLTLPRKVEVPLAININGRPTQMRNTWYEFHLNGTGTRCDPPLLFWDDEKDVVTINEPKTSQQLYAACDLMVDNGTSLRVYGYDQTNTWAQSIETDGTVTDGILIPVDTDNTLPETNTVFFKTITRIVKGESKGFIKLNAWDHNNNTSLLIGYYAGDETEPNYRRIKINRKACWCRVKYRKRFLKVTSLSDPLHLKSKLSITLAMRAIASFEKGDLQAAEGYEQKALQMLSEEQLSRNPDEAFSFQYDTRTEFADRLQGIV